MIKKTIVCKRYGRLGLIKILTLLFLLNPLTAQEIRYLEGSTQKVSQLVGDFDLERRQSAQNMTLTNYQIWGTDLGIPFQHKGKTYLLFGDVPGDVGFGPDRDPIAYTEDTRPDDGIDLTFITESPGLFKPITIPGTSQGAFEVPLDGISIRDAMYVYHSTDHMSRSILARSVDDGHSFELMEDTISVDYFVNVSIEKVNRRDVPDLPGSFENGLVALGTGDYRNSAVYLFCQDEDSISHRESIYYFAGFSGMKPLWTRKEGDAVPVINTGCAGELSFAYNEPLEKWLVLYNCDDPRGIIYRTSDSPWGPYSNSELLFDPWEDHAYCSYMHVSWESSVCDSVHDPGRENEWGGEYGPYQFNEWSTRDDSIVHIYYTLSTWNPYTTVLMKSSLVKPGSPSSEKRFIEDPPFQIYPNPTRGQFRISSPDRDEKLLEVILYSSEGRRIRSWENTPEIDLTGFPSGLYLGQAIYQSDYLYCFKIVKN